MVFKQAKVTRTCPRGVAVEVTGQGYSMLAGLGAGGKAKVDPPGLCFR